MSDQLLIILFCLCLGKVRSSVGTDPRFNRRSIRGATFFARGCVILSCKQSGTKCLSHTTAEKNIKVYFTILYIRNTSKPYKIHCISIKHKIVVIVDYLAVLSNLQLFGHMHSTTELEDQALAGSDKAQHVVFEPGSPIYLGSSELHTPAWWLKKRHM